MFISLFLLPGSEGKAAAEEKKLYSNSKRNLTGILRLKYLQHTLTSMARTLLLIALLAGLAFTQGIPDVSSNNNFTRLQRKSLDALIKLVETDNSQNPVLQDITQGILFIGACKNDLGLVAWSLEKGSDAGKALDSTTSNVVRMSGFVECLDL